MEMQGFWIIVFLIFVGQTLGSLVGLIKKPGKTFLQYSFSFAAAMMIGISFFELIPEALGIAPYIYALIGFVMGALAIIAVDRTLPHLNPELGEKEKPNVKRSVSMLVIGIALHNIPEGLAIGISFALEPSLGLLIAIGIAAQDIPENIATIISVYALTRKKLRSFAILVGTIVFEVFGFIFGYFVLYGMPTAILSMSLAGAAAIMVYISVEELLPCSELSFKPYKKTASILVGLATVLLMILLF